MVCRRMPKKKIAADPFRFAPLEYLQCRALSGHKWDVCPPLPDVQPPRWGTTVFDRCDRCEGHRMTTWPAWGAPYRRYFPPFGYDLGVEGPVDRGEVRASALRRLAEEGRATVGERPARDEPAPAPRRRLRAVG